MTMIRYLLFFLITVVNNNSNNILSVYGQSTTTTTTTTTAEIGTTNETIQAAKEYYVIPKSYNGIIQFQCTYSGARCVYQREDYIDTQTIGYGLISETLQGPTWASINTTTDYLQLNTCTNGSTNITSALTSTGATGSTSTTRSGDTEAVEGDMGCLVVCTSECTCELMNTSSTSPSSSSKDCLALSGPPIDNEIVATQPPIPNMYNTCQNTLHTEFCTQMMSLPPPALEEGLQFDCYNFCGGIFISSCDLQKGSCGSTTCDNATADGTITGRVFGCTDKHRPTNDTTSSSTSNASSKNNIGTYFVSTSLVASLVLFGLIMMH